MFGGGATAAAHDLDAVVGNELGEVLGETLGGEVVVHLAVDDAGQAGVRQTGQRHRGRLAELAQRLVHFDWTGGAVKANGVDAEGAERGNRGTDLGTGQHAAGQFNRDLGLDWYDATVADHGALAGGNGGLTREEVEHRLHEQDVNATLQETVGHLFVAGREFVVRDLAEGGELGARPNGAGHEAGLAGGRVLVGDAAREPG